jgi:hypothetical protein
MAAIDDDMNNSQYRPNPGSPIKKESWSRNKKIGVSIIVLLAIIVIVVTADIPGNREDTERSSLSQQEVTSDRDQLTPPGSYESDTDQILLAPDGLQP